MHWWRSMKNKDKHPLSKYHKPNIKLYLMMIVIALLIRLSPFSIGIGTLNTVFNELSIGVVGSAIFAWLIDWMDCKKRNKEKAAKERMILNEYHSSITGIKLFVARRAAFRCNNVAQKRNFDEWLFIYSDIKNYNNSKEDLKISYDRLITEVEVIYESLSTIKQQYFLLVSEGFVCTDDFKQHINYQSNLCADIFEFAKSDDYSTINELLRQIVEKHDIFSSKDYSKKYTWKSVG